MLRRLNIENLVLLQKAQLQLGRGFTIITGETGSGKTIFLQALKYVTGERADADAVRNGSNKALIEAEFEPIERQFIQSHLDEAGIEWEEGSPLLLKREISREGRNRAFINCQMVTLSLLQKIGELLIDFTDQHAHHALKKSGKQRLLIDLFGKLSPLVEEAKYARENFEKLEEKISILKQQSEAKDRDLEKIRFELEEIESAKIKKDEEETLGQEHHRLAHAQELTEKTGQILRLLEDPPFAMIAQTRKMLQWMQQIASIDASLQDEINLCQEVSVDIQEIHSSLNSYLSKIEANPKRLEFIEERLALIEKLKRKYGDPFAHLISLKEKEHILCSYDEEIESLTQKSKEAQKIAVELAERRFAMRSQASSLFSELVTKKLRSLNMPYAAFSIEITYGFAEDQIAFHLQANPGQPGGPIQEFASGGELSRLMIALQAILAEKYPTPTIVFDEIDANIGGETATIVGEIFHQVGKAKQVLAITHFPQVAKQADHHLKIGKHLNEIATLTTIEILEKKERDKELLRMLGGMSLSS